VEFCVAGIVRDRSLNSFNQIDQEKSSLARIYPTPIFDPVTFSTPHEHSRACLVGETRWSTWEAPATALAAAEAAGMPVRRPRRPAAVSAADAAGAGPELGCAGQLERAAEAPIDEASSLWVGLSVDQSVDRSSLVGVCIWFTRGWLPSRGFDPPAGCCRITETGLFWRLVSSSRLSVGLRRCW